MTLPPYVVMDLFDPLVLYLFCLSTRRLLELKHKIIDPERPTIKVPVLVLLKDLARFIYGSFDFLEETSPLGHQGGFSVYVTFGGVDLCFVDCNGCFQATVTTGKIG